MSKNMLGIAMSTAAYLFQGKVDKGVSGKDLARMACYHRRFLELNEIKRGW